MRGRMAAAFVLVVVVGASATLAIALLTTHARFSTALAVAAGAASATASAAVFGLAWSRYRVSRNPSALFMATAFGVLAAQALVFALWWPFGHQNPFIFEAVTIDRASAPMDGTQRIPVLASLTGWLAASACFALALPWRDRRGRPPVRAITVLAGAFASATLFLDIVVLSPTYATPYQVEGTSAGGSIGLGWAGWVLVIPSIYLLTIAAARHLAADDPSRRLIGVGVLLGAAYLGSTLIFPSTGTGIVHFGDALPPVIALLVFVGILGSQRAETTTMRRATDRANEVMGGRAEIASMVAHEVRGPVTTISGLASTARQHYDRLGDDDRQEFFRLIGTEATRLLRTADQTSMALKVDAGALPYDKQPESLAEVIREAVGRTETGEHPVDVDVDEDIVVSLDRARIVEALREVLDNAAKFSPSESLISVRAYRERADAVIEITDGGPGIAPLHRLRIFQRFPGIRPTGYEEVPGTGLGLFIARAHVREHGGDMTANDGPDGGTMLAVRLPLEGSG